MSSLVPAQPLRPLVPRYPAVRADSAPEETPGPAAREAPGLLDRVGEGLLAGGAAVPVGQVASAATVAASFPLVTALLPRHGDLNGALWLLTAMAASAQGVMVSSVVAAGVGMAAGACSVAPPPEAPGPVRRWLEGPASALREGRAALEEASTVGGALRAGARCGSRYGRHVGAAAGAVQGLYQGLVVGGMAGLPPALGAAAGVLVGSAVGAAAGAGAGAVGGAAVGLAFFPAARESAAP